MRGAALRWVLAALAAAALIAGAAGALRDRRLTIPSPLPAVERLAGQSLPPPPPPVPSLAVAGTGLARQPSRAERSGRGLAHCLVEEGRPDGVLAPLDLKALLPAPAGGPPGDARAGRLPAPAASREQFAAARERASAAALEALPVDVAPRPRRLPPAPAPPDPGPKLLPPGTPPATGQRPLTGLPAPRSAPESEPAGPVAPPPTPERLPAPPVPAEATR